MNDRESSRDSVVSGELPAPVSGNIQEVLKLHRCQGSDERTRNQELLVSNNRTRSISALSAEVHGISRSTRLTNFQAIVHILKASVGTGVLAMPSAIRDAGLLFGPIGILIVAGLIVHSMHLLVRAAQRLRKVAEENGETDVNLDYAETVERAFRRAPAPWNRQVWLAPTLKICLIICQIGFLGSYQIFVAVNIQRMVKHFEPPYQPPVGLYLLFIGVVLLPVVLIKSLKTLSLFSGLANLLAFAGLAITVVYCMLDLQAVDTFPLIRSFDTLPLFFGVTVFAFESINLLLPIENQMEHHEDIRGKAGVLNLSMTIVLAIYITVGFYGYLKFGEMMDESIIFSMPMQPFYFMLCKPMYTISILISYALQFYVLFSIIWEKVKTWLTTPRQLFWGELALRLGGVVMSTILAYAIPDFELLISFFGSFTGSAITLLFPSLIDAVMVWTDRTRIPRYRLLLLKDFLLFLAGIVGAIIGTFTTIKAIIEKAGKADTQ